MVQTIKIKWLFFVTAVAIFAARVAAKGARTPAPALSAPAARAVPAVQFQPAVLGGGTAAARGSGAAAGSWYLY